MGITMGGVKETTTLQKLSHETYVNDNSYMLPVLTGFLLQHEYNEMINNETDIEMEFISTECGVFFDYCILCEINKRTKGVGIVNF